MYVSWGYIDWCSSQRLPGTLRLLWAGSNFVQRDIKYNIVQGSIMGNRYKCILSAELHLDIIIVF